MPPVKAAMKKDGRKLDRKAQEAIRLMAVERVREGESPSAVIASYGMNRTTIHKWLNRAKGKGAGVRKLRARKATGRPRTLTGKQERQIFHWVNGKNPMHYGFDFGLWTRQIVRELVQQKFGVTLSLASIGALLARLGLTPQKPLQRAYQRDPEAIERWQRETYPAIAQRAKTEQADIYFWDESGFRADAVHGKTWGVKGLPAGGTGARATPERQRGVGGQRQRRILVHHVQGGAVGRVVRGTAQEADGAPQKAAALGARWPARTQEGGGEGVCGEHAGQAHAAFPARLCARSEPG